MKVALLLLLVACQKHEDETKPVALDVDKCKVALHDAPTLAPARRAKAIIDACQPCGPWQLLRWATKQSDGGPTRLALDQQLQACGTCNTDARSRFMGALDDARGTDSRTPWREYGKACNLPDARFASAPWFALDKIARDIGANSDTAPLLAGIELRMPAVSVSGSGYELPTASVIGPHAGPTAITVTAKDMMMGSLPVGRLTAKGLEATSDYPGVPFDPTAPPSGAAASPGNAGLVGPAQLPSGPVAIVAPKQLAARRILDALVRPAYLAVAAPGQPEGWVVPGVVPVELTRIDAIDGTPQRIFKLGASPDALLAELKAKAAGTASVLIEVDAEASVQGLAQLLGALAFTGAHTAMIMASQP